MVPLDGIKGTLRLSLSLLLSPQEMLVFGPQAASLLSHQWKESLLTNLLP